MFVRGKLLIAGIASLSVLTSCASIKNSTLKKELSQVNPPKPEDIFVEENPILKMEVGNVLYKKDNLNHRLSYNPDVDFIVFQKPIYLKDITFSIDDQILDIPIRVEDEVAYEIIPPLTLHGKLSDVLEQISVLTNSYWTYESGVIVFKRYKTVVYRLPYEPFTKLNLVYNAGHDDSEKINLDQIKEDVFDELVNVAKSILESRYVEGNIVREIETSKGRLNKGRNLYQDKDILNKGKKKSHIAQKGATFENGKNQTTDSTSLATKEDKTEKESGVNNKSNSTSNKSKSTATSLLDNGAVLVDVVSDKDLGRNEKSEKISKYKKDSDIAKWERSDNEVRENTKNVNKLNEMNKEKEEKFGDKEVVQISKKLVRPQTPVVASKESGIIVVRTSRYNEKALDSAIKETIKKNLSELVLLDIYVMESNVSSAKEISLELAGLLKSHSNELNMELKGNETAISLTTLAESTINGITKGINISALANYIVNKGKGKVLANPNLAILPNHIAKVSSAVKVPYIEPQNISIGGTNSQLSYQIKSIDDGISLVALPIPAGEDSILLSLSVKANRYLGDKQVNAGTLGTITVPIQSPRDLRTSIRVKAGNVFILGGVKQQTIKRDDRRVFGVFPNTDSYTNENKKLLILGKVRILKFFGGEE